MGGIDLNGGHLRIADLLQHIPMFDEFYPGYAHTFTEIGKERGWPSATRAQFDTLRGPTGALLIGNAKTVADKVFYGNEVLGGLARITFQMGVSALPHEKMLRSIELLGAGVAPIIRKELSASLSQGKPNHISAPFKIAT